MWGADEVVDVGHSTTRCRHVFSRVAHTYTHGRQERKES